MSASLSATAKMIRPSALLKPLPVVVVLVLAVWLVLYENYDSYGNKFSTWLNPRSDKFYSAAFTFLTTFWGASLSVWALLKSRTTRYIERLQENKIYKQFIRQYERRLVYAFGALSISFAIYAQDMKLAQSSDISVIIFFGWSAIYICSIAALIDVIYTAREVL